MSESTPVSSSSSSGRDRSHASQFESMSWDDAMDDLAARHVLSMPDEQLMDMVRVCFQIEQA